MQDEKHLIAPAAIGDVIFTSFHGMLYEPLSGMAAPVVDLNRLPITTEGRHVGCELLQLADAIADSNFDGLRWLAGCDVADVTLCLMSLHNEYGCAPGLWLLHINDSTIEGLAFLSSVKRALTMPHTWGENRVNVCLYAIGQRYVSDDLQMPAAFAAEHERMQLQAGRVPQ
ncbi:hypothetical protein D9M68_752700 [compost metagenome]